MKSQKIQMERRSSDPGMISLQLKRKPMLEDVDHNQKVSMAGNTLAKSTRFREEDNECIVHSKISNLFKYYHDQRNMSLSKKSTRLALQTCAFEQ